MRPFLISRRFLVGVDLHSNIYHFFRTQRGMLPAGSPWSFRYSYVNPSKIRWCRGKNVGSLYRIRSFWSIA
jgi:hypothetical protein